MPFNYLDNQKAIAGQQLMQGTPMKLTLKEQTRARLENAQRELAVCEELLKLLEANPETQRIIDLLSYHY